MKKKSVALFLALALVVGAVIGGTLAWLTADTAPVLNTFTTSDIDITLAEEAGGTEHQFKMVPGYTITKDPKVTVERGSEKCYLFVKLEKSSNFDTFLEYEMAEGWTQLKNSDNSDVAGVYYREVESANDDQSFYVLKNNQVTVKDTVTKAHMESLNTNSTYPTLTVTAYASQYMKDNDTPFSALEAWKNVNPSAAE